MNQQLSFDAPAARSSDPQTSHLAAATVRPGSRELISAIRIFTRLHPCSSAFEIADGVRDAHGDRWDSSTIRTAVSRAGLEVAPLAALSPRGRVCETYRLPVIDTDPL